MDFDLFVRILDRIEKNRPDERHEIGLFSWGEPLMHNRIGDIVAEVNRRGWRAVISTNGNAVKHLEAAIKARPAVFSLSTSGFSQETYNHTHFKGDADVLLSTIFRAWNLIKQHSPQTDFVLHFHIYKDNGQELATLQRIVRALDCDFCLSIATVLSVDDVIEALEGTDTLRREQTNVLPKLIISPQEQKRLAAPYNDGKCPQIEEDRIVINADGSVELCCTVFGDQYSLAPSFLDVSEDEIFRKRRESTVCGKCMNAGIPFMGAAEAHSPELKKFVSDALAANGAGRFAYYGSFGVKNMLMLRGHTVRHLTKSAKRRARRAFARVGQLVT